MDPSPSLSKILNNWSKYCSPAAPWQDHHNPHYNLYHHLNWNWSFHIAMQYQLDPDTLPEYTRPGPSIAAVTRGPELFEIEIVTKDGKSIFPMCKKLLFWEMYYIMAIRWEIYIIPPFHEISLTLYSPLLPHRSTAESSLISLTRLTSLTWFEISLLADIKI